MTKPSPDSGKRATPADHAKGHRARMRGKLLEKGSAALTELEILEMLLYAGAPRGDTKPLAKRLIKTFKSLSAVLRASPDELRPIKDMGDAAIAAVKIAEAAGLQISHSRVKGKPVLTHWMEVQDYCISKLAHEPIEYVMVLCLDSQNRLIANETFSRGTRQSNLCLSARNFQSRAPAFRPCGYYCEKSSGCRNQVFTRRCRSDKRH
jgi:DNA repair protein RadC